MYMCVFLVQLQSNFQLVLLPTLLALCSCRVRLFWIYISWQSESNVGSLCPGVSVKHFS